MNGSILIAEAQAARAILRTRALTVEREPDPMDALRLSIDHEAEAAHA